MCFGASTGSERTVHGKAAVADLLRAVWPSGRPSRWCWCPPTAIRPLVISYKSTYTAVYTTTLQSD